MEMLEKLYKYLFIKSFFCIKIVLVRDRSLEGMLLFFILKRENLLSKTLALRTHTGTGFAFLLSKQLMGIVVEYC